MTNRIQLRRDTSANWSRVNPILEDGEPGLDITTNQIKYGDGSTDWDNLPYASGGGGGDSIVNGNYSVSVGADGVVTMETSRGSLEFGALPEPGGPSHFHIMRTSGDDADLYFGDDFNYMLQRGPALGQTPGYGVEIGTKDIVAGSQNVWRFETDGSLTLPQNGRVSEETEIVTVTLDQFTDGGYPGTQVFTKVSATLYQILPSGPTIELSGGFWRIKIGVSAYYASTDLITWTALGGGLPTPVGTLGTLLTMNLTVNNNSWAFDADGILTFPDGDLTIGTVAGEVQIGTISTDLNILRNGVDGVEIFENEVSFYAGNTKRAQVVPTGLEIISGNLTFPDSTTQSTAFDITKFGEGFSLTAADKIVTNKLYSTNETQPTQHYRLELDTNGVVVLPDQSIINGSTLRGIYGTGEANYTGITIGPDAAHREESWVWVDHTGVSIATEYSTDAYTWKFDNNGSLTLPGGSAIGYTPSVSTNITVNAKTWAFGVDGNLTLPTGGEIHSAAGTGSVAIEANDGNNTRTWTFGTDGSLTFPDTTTQSTAYKRTTGSWTVATGSGTYSFTVPLNGTYTMWVKGNIDDGIIVWNATATVTNNNVPVIGQQFAWNYTGAGTPIEITVMPTQFVGTVNTIVSSNPSVGNTSNVFNFTINNDSGSEKTVYWGYVTQ